MDYYEQLKTKEWQRKRLDILLRDRFECQLCSFHSYNKLHVHHKVYKKKLMAWEYPDEDLISLCSLCHNKVHRSLIIEKSILKTKVSSIIENYIKNNTLLIN